MPAPVSPGPPYDASLLPERIRSKFRVDPRTGCWLWTAMKQRNGRGKVHWSPVTVPAHRLIYHLLTDRTFPISGSARDDLQPRCGQSSCVRPDHMRLEGGTPLDGGIYDFTMLPWRFRDKVDINLLTGCWNWQEALDTGGYGKYRMPRRGPDDPPAKSHRVAYYFLVDPELPIFPGRTHEHDLDHLCRNRHCVNPGHLEPASNRVNVLRGLKGVKGDHASTYPGVNWDRCRGRWRSRIRVTGKRQHLGYFDDELDAFKAYLNALHPVDPAAHKELTTLFSEDL